MKNPILNLQEIELSFGGKPLFTKLSLSIYPNDRICLVGKNGEGKSSLLKIIANSYELDGGQKWVLPGTSIGYLPQEINYEKDQTIYDFVLEELTNRKELDQFRYLADIIISPLKLDPNSLLSELSGGLLRRAFLAKTLVMSPDILLLDEPTNHLDIDTIEWLEGYIKGYHGAVVCISHDRAFLRNASNKTFWLDRGTVKVNNAGYDDFDKWSVEILEQEQRELEKLSKKLSEEEKWKLQGVTARRKRNQKRLAELYELRERTRHAKSAQKQLLNKIKLDPLAPQLFSKLICEFNNVYKDYGNKHVLKSFSTRIMRGDKIGIIGPNGTGKTTFLRLLVGDEKPDNGTIKLGKTINITYYDQKRVMLNREDTLWETLCPGGGDYIEVGGNLMHVVAYLKNFLFDPKQARDKVATLSGGQANRLLLAKALANPGSLLILDEPTNDLDMDTLDMIQELLLDYQGTLIVVSHDREFLDGIITKTFHFEGHGVIEEFLGSYTELRQLEKKQLKSNTIKKAFDRADNNITAQKSKKLSYGIQRELSLIPERISNLEEEITTIENKLSDESFYRDSLDAFNNQAQRLVECKTELEALWKRWAELESLK